MGDVDEFVRRFQQAVPFAANVRDVQTFVFAGDLAQGDQFIGLGIKGRGINKRRANAKGAFLHRLAHQLFHSLQFIRCGRTVSITNLVDTHRRRTDK